MNPIPSASTTSRYIDLEEYMTDTGFASPTLQLKQPSFAPELHRDYRSTTSLIAKHEKTCLPTQHASIYEDPRCASLLVPTKSEQDSMEHQSQNCEQHATTLNTASATSNITSISPEDRRLIYFLDKLEQEIDLSILNPNQQDTNCFLEPNAIIPCRHDEDVKNVTFCLPSEKYCTSTSTQVTIPCIGDSEEGDERYLQDWKSKNENLKEQAHAMTEVDKMRLDFFGEKEDKPKELDANGLRCRIFSSGDFSLMEGKDTDSVCMLMPSVNRSSTIDPHAKRRVLLPPDHAEHTQARLTTRQDDDSTSLSSLRTLVSRRAVSKDCWEMDTLRTCRNFKPIPALNAYNFFFIDERDRILSGRAHDEYDENKKLHLLLQHLTKDRSKRRQHRKSHGKIDFISLSRTIGHRWKTLPEEQKKFYRDVAASDLERYNQDIGSQQVALIQTNEPNSVAGCVRSQF